MLQNFLRKKRASSADFGMYAEKANDIVIEILDDEGNCVKSHTFTIRTKKTAEVTAQRDYGEKMDRQNRRIPIL